MAEAVERMLDLTPDEITDKSTKQHNQLPKMNLLALLERRMPPEIPPGIGRVVMFHGEPLMEDKPAHTVKKIEGQMANRRNILAAIADGLQLTHEICKRTGLCKTSVFNHCNVLAQQGLVRIERGKVVNTYHIAKPKRGRGEK